VADILRKSFQQVSEEAGYAADWGDRVVAQMDDLRKALALGSYPTTAGTTFADAGPLRLQNLDATMTNVLFTEQYIKLYNFLTKTPSTQPYYEWNRRRSYGSSRASTGFAEGGAPKGGVSQFERNGIYNKYKGTRRGITHQLSLTGQLMGTQIDPVAEENRNGTLALLENIERDLMFGLESIKDESGNAVNWDGILAQMDATYGPASLGYAPHVVDKGGAPMSFGDFDDIAESLYKNGFVSNFDADLHAFMSPSILTDLTKIKIESGTIPISSTFGAIGNAGATITGQSVDRRLLGQTQTGYQTGMPLKGHNTNFGFLGFDPWIFGERVKGDAPLTAAEAGAPTTPALPTGLTAGVTVGSKWTTTQAAGNHFYKVSAFNDSGEGAVSAASAAITLAVSEAITVTFPAAPAGSATGWRLYRTDGATGGTYRWIADVPIASATYVDKNTKIPGTGYVFVLNKNPETMVVSQMTPLIRYPLAIVTTTVEWLLLLYMVPVLKAGERIAIFKNVGRV
jgi:hypothetical protein